MTRSMTVGRRAVRLAVGAAAVALAVTGCSAGQIAETAMKAPSVATVSADSTDGKLAVRGLAVAYEGVEGYPAGGNAPLHVTLINQRANPLTVTIDVAAPADGADPTATSARAVQIVAGETATTAPTPAAESPSATGSPAAPESPETTESPTGQQAEPNTASSASEDEGGQEQNAEPNASVPASPSAGTGSPSPSQTSSAPVSGRAATVQIPANGSVVFSPESAERLMLIGLAGALRSGMSVTLTFQATEGGSASPLLTVVTPVDIPLTPAPREAVEEEHHE
ncbi:hypothetical protein [Catenuloplanes atrovinosus]|uniref:Copper chaperone PCu(A)C n=1 Tax=Catenuloplanes atrovinosus TaxID=137266 RepID=A0AAE3YVA5_9ACTN|nr:hypothetical protein [Catenuloplanes atrovinosus]MDR7280325.1 hypothetical protein [Catenuloplanes atrovinosus]